MLFHFKSFLYMHYSQTYEASNSLIMVAGIFFFIDEFPMVCFESDSEWLR